MPQTESAERSSLSTATVPLHAGPAPSRMPGIWRREKASRAAVLRDGAAYFGALRSALLRAEREVLIVGWDIDSRTPLVGESGKAEDDLPRELGAFLKALVRRKPKLTVRLLLWDYSVLFTAEREPLARLTLGWQTPRQIEFCLDDAIPLGSSHHQKIVVIDDTVAFSGGIDLAIRRWDTSRHRFQEPARLDPGGVPYRPFHDVQFLVEGDAARALGDLVRERWRHARCRTLKPSPPRTDSAWPPQIEADFVGCTVGISRTQPPFRLMEEVREVEALFEAMIDAAEETIYIENQFVTSTPLARRIGARMQARPKLELLIVAPQKYDTWLESKTMRAGRIRFMDQLRACGVADRVRLLTPMVEDAGGSTDVMVHAKVMIVDDRILRIGSANLNNRSMGTDTECDLFVQAETRAERDTIRRLRDTLLGDHVGTEVEAVAAAIAEHGSLLRAAEELRSGTHRLVLIEDGTLEAPDTHLAVSALADPERPIDPEAFMAMMAEQRPVRRNLSNLSRLLLIAGTIAVLVLVWQVTPLRNYANFETIEALVATVESHPLAPLYVVLGFVVAGLVAFPVTVAIAVTAVTFGTFLGLAYAAAGTLASALVTYGVGALVGRGGIESLLGRRAARISRRVSDRGILAVAAIRMVPIAPFTVVNLLAGASRIRIRDYIIGTMLGLTPGFLVIAPLGRQAYEVLTEPSLEDSLLLGGLAALWLAVSYGLQRLVSRFEKSRQ